MIDTDVSSGVIRTLDELGIWIKMWIKHRQGLDNLIRNIKTVFDEYFEEAMESDDDFFKKDVQRSIKL